MAVAWSQKEMAHEHARINHHRRCVGEAAPVAEAPIKVDRREQYAATRNRVIVVAIDENVATGCPHIMIGHPIPVLISCGPITGPPGVPVLLPNPTAW